MARVAAPYFLRISVMGRSPSQKVVNYEREREGVEDKSGPARISLMQHRRLGPMRKTALLLSRKNSQWSSFSLGVSSVRRLWRTLRRMDVLWVCWCASTESIYKESARNTGKAPAPACRRGEAGPDSVSPCPDSPVRNVPGCVVCAAERWVKRSDGSPRFRWVCGHGHAEERA